MSWLAAVPAWCWWLLALGIVAGGQQLRIADVRTDLVTTQRDFSDYQAEVEKARRAAEAGARSEEQRRAVAVEGIRTDAQEKIQAAKTAAADADAVARKLREQLARLTQRLAGDSGSAGGGEAAGSACLVLAELFERADARAGELAAAYDSARIAGDACSTAYDALSGPVDGRP